MRKLTCIVIFVLFSPTLHAQNFTAVADSDFIYEYGGNSFDEARSIKELPGGGYIIAGSTSSFGQGNISVYLMKTDSLGKHVWSSTYGGILNDLAYSVEVTADSGYFVAGYSNSFGWQQQTGYDAYYFKTNKNGILQWQKTIAGADWDFIYGSTPMPDGGFILCGKTYTNSAGGSDAYLIRLNKSGDTLWTKRYGGKFDEKFTKVNLLYGRLYAVGSNATHATDTIADGWLVKLDTNGIVLKDTFISGSKNYEETLLGITSDAKGYFYVCGKTILIDSNSVMGILARIDTSFNFYYLNPLGITKPGNSLSSEQVINIGNGNVFVVGSAIGHFGGQDMFFLGIDTTFKINYARHVGGDQDDYAYAGILTKSGRIICVGSTQSFCAESDVFLVRFNSDSLAGDTSAGLTKNLCFTDTLDLWQAGIQNYNPAMHLDFFPNPANFRAQLNISCDEQKIFSVNIFSVLGNEVMNFLVPSNTSFVIDLSGLPSGNYFLKSIDDTGKYLSAIKFVKN